jgi:hypothetical protein
VIPGKYTVELLIHDRSDIGMMKILSVTNLIAGDNTIDLRAGPNQAAMTLKIR